MWFPVKLSDSQSENQRNTVEALPTHPVNIGHFLTHLSTSALTSQIIYLAKLCIQTRLWLMLKYIIYKIDNLIYEKFPLACGKKII